MLLVSIHPFIHWWQWARGNDTAAEYHLILHSSLDLRGKLMLCYSTWLQPPVLLPQNWLTSSSQSDWAVAPMPQSTRLTERWVQFEFKEQWFPPVLYLTLLVIPNNNYPKITGQVVSKYWGATYKTTYRLVWNFTLNIFTFTLAL